MSTSDPLSATGNWAAVIERLDEGVASHRSAATAALSEIDRASAALDRFDVVRRHADGRVLVVDDDDLVRRSLCELLRVAGARTRSAATAAEAKALMGEELFEVVVVDLKLGEGEESGVELLEHARRMTLSRLVAITGMYPEPRVRRLVEQFGAKFLTKPLGAERFLAAVAPTVGGEPH